jgi:hypothetical protein
MTKKAAVTDTSKSKGKDSVAFQRFYKWNIWLAALHTAQGLAILLLSTTKAFPVHVNHLTLDPIASELAGTPVLGYATQHLFDINVAYLVASFFFMSAIAHGVAATVYRKRYEFDLKKGINKARWIEYAFSASTMLVAIALLTGVSDLGSLKMIFIFGLIMSAMGLVMELWNQGRNKVQWLPYAIGCIAGIVPWGVFALYMWSAGVYGTEGIPAFVYWIYVSMFMFFAGFAVNMYLQYKKIGKWSDYLYGERVYMLLSLVAKTVLAWQVFAGALRP